MTRIPRTEFVYPLGLRFRFPSGDYLAEIVNYHFKGACLRVPPEVVPQLRTLKVSEMGLDVFLGRQCLRRFVPFRIAWESMDTDGLLGVEFLVPVATFIQRPERFPTHPQYPPLVSSMDPLNANRTLYFKVLNLSANGMLLGSSLANKHLLPGMVLKKALLSLPGDKTIPIELRIANVRCGDNVGSMQVGAAYLDCPKPVRKAVQRYLSVLSPGGGASRLDRLASGGMLAKRLRKGLSFRVIEKAEEYEQVLRLRFEAYASHGKVRPGADWREQGEGLDKEGMVLGAFLGGQLVATLEMRFGGGPLPLKTLALIGKERLPGIDLLGVGEVNRLAVHPSAQGTDVVLGLFQLVHAIFINRGGLELLLMATDKLKPLYEGIGALDYGLRIPHPSIPGEHLNLLIIKRDAYLHAKGINAFAWLNVYRASHRAYEDIGLVPKVKISLFRWAEAGWYGLWYGVAKIRRRLALKGKPPSLKPTAPEDESRRAA